MQNALLINGSTADDGLAWRDLPVTLQAKTTANGFTSAQRVFFRVRGIIKDATLPWTPTVSIIIQ